MASKDLLYPDFNNMPHHIQEVAKKSPDHRTLKEIALLQLWNRTARLRRLLELEAPEIILVNEVSLILRAGTLLDHKHLASKFFEPSVMGAKISMGFCKHDDCEKKADSCVVITDETRDLVEELKELCPEHQKELLDFNDMGDVQP